MAGMIEYAVEHGMMEKTALNAMSRKGYRQLDLAHRMIGQAEKGLEASGAGARAKRLAKERLADLRTDYLHPTRHSVLGDMKGSKRLYKPLHTGDVDPGLARVARRLAGANMAKERALEESYNSAVRNAKSWDERGELYKIKQKENQRVTRAANRAASRGDLALYAPHYDSSIATPESAKLSGRGTSGWRKNTLIDGGGMHGRSTLRRDSALNALRQQLQKSNRLLLGSAARSKG